jgi:alcohol dehydrogenase (NADP+)
MTTPARGYAAYSANEPMAPFSFERRDLRPEDVQIDILYCGVCHSDLHTAHGEWDGLIYPNGTIYPCVPGHEIVGRVKAIGNTVSKFKVGDLVGVGCMVDSCQHCDACDHDLEQHCEHGATWTYNSLDRVTGDNTYGGYSDVIVVREEFVLNVRHAEKDLASVAPLLCAGITMWSPLRHWNVTAGKKVGIVGIGGLGHMGIKLARALGAHVVAFTTSESKRDDAFKLGAHEVVVSRNAHEMAAQANSLDFIINTVAAPHDLDAYLGLLKRDGTMTVVGIPAEPHPSPSVASLIGMRRSLAGSLIGGIAETQEMLDFCAEHGILSEIETVPMQDIDVAFSRMQKSDVKYRFVIDMASIKQAA